LKRRRVFALSHQSITSMPRASAVIRDAGLLLFVTKSERVSRAIYAGGAPTRYLAAAAEALERVKGIEPSSSAWKAVALPLSYTRAEKAFFRN
jgi:hypothetical protein